MLTAFLIESYTALQPDPQSEMVFLLHRIATQNYSINGGFLNVTSALPSRPPFEAPTWALRVNGLWFSSLIVSLSAASLGILVKSWLREYLAGEWISPQEKLRARQYRNPALSQWKVFEIAAALPLLLQLALGLFFVGLCFFTASVDERMALTSIPIVAAWAFFLAMTTVAPLLTPRCPFKIPFLKRALKSGRRHLLPRLRQLLDFLLTTTDWSASLGSKQEEEEFVRGGQEGADLLLSLDAIMADDSLLYTLWDAFKQSSPSPDKSTQFVLRLIRHRMGSVLDAVPSQENLTYILDLTTLSQRAYETTMRIVAEILKPAPAPYQNSSAEWIHNAMLLLLSRSAHSLPHDALSVLHTFLDDKSASWWTGDTIGIRFAPVLESRRPQLITMSPQLLHLYTSASLTQLELMSPLRLYNRMLRILGEVQDAGVSILATVRSNPRLLTDDRVRPVLEDVWSFASGAVTADRLQSARGGSLECLLLAAEIGARLGKTYELSKMLSTYWSTFRKRFLTVMLFCSAAPHMRIQNVTERLEVFEEAFFIAEPKGTSNLRLRRTSAMLTSSAPAQTSILTNSTDVAKTFCTDAYTAEKGYDPLDVVLFTWVHLRIYKRSLTRSKDDLAESPPSTRVAEAVVRNPHGATQVLGRERLGRGVHQTQLLGRPRV